MAKVSDSRGVLAIRIWSQAELDKLFETKSSTHNSTIADAINKTGLEAFMGALAKPRSRV